MSSLWCIVGVLEDSLIWINHAAPSAIDLVYLVVATVLALAYLTAVI